MAETFSAERKEDIFVLIIAAVSDLLVLSNVIGKDFVKPLFF